MAKPWFRNKKYGYGWGLPQTWQGWVVLLCYLVFIFIDLVTINENTLSTRPYYFVKVLLGTLIFLGIVYKTSEKPKWRWGEKQKTE